MRANKIYIVLSLLLIAGTVAAGDIEKGRELHSENCINCHASMMGGDGTGIYTRPDRRIEDYAGLKKQVKRCKNSLGVSWPEHQIDDLLTYLNTTFYKFEVTAGD